MKGDAKVIELLNEALKNELTAVNQYWLHYRLLDNKGIAKLAEFERHESIDEMKHADRLVEQLKGAIAHCETVRDYASRDLFAEILRNEEEHVDTLEQQFEMIERMGLQNYIQLQSSATEG